METLDIVNVLMGAAVKEALRAACNVSGTFSFSSPEVSWQARGVNASTWCRLFDGDRFTRNVKGSLMNSLPKPVVTNGLVYVPSVRLKDIVSMTERTQVYATNNGTQTERVCDLQCRKITTSQVTITAFKGCRAMRVQSNRFFIDEMHGPLPVLEALKCVVNSESFERELVMKWDLLVDFAAYIWAHNDSGGYAVFEVAQLSDNWYAVRNIIILGKETGNHRQPVELHTASVSHKLRQGGRYIREYQSARGIGAGRSMNMVTEYRSRSGVQPSTQDHCLPTSWESLVGKNEDTSESWQIPVQKNQYSVDQDGTIHMETFNKMKMMRSRPLFGHVLALEERSSKTNCYKLIDKSDIEQEAKPFPGHTSTLSLLGAVVQDSNGNHWNGQNCDYARADGIASILLAKTISSNPDLISVNVVDTGRKHDAGKRGVFPVYKLVLVVRITTKWYDFNTLKPTAHDESSVRALCKKIRYVELGASTNHDFERTLAMDVPNKRTTVDEDAQGNKVITTKVAVMACDETEPNVGDDGAASARNSSNMTAVVPVPANDARQSYRIDDEEKGMANPHISSQQGHLSNSRNTVSVEPDNVITAPVVAVRAGGTTKSYQSKDEECGMVNPYLSSHQELHSHGSDSLSQWPSSHVSQGADAKPKDNPDLDPELALALRMSMKEVQVCQQPAAVSLSSYAGEGPSQENEKSSPVAQGADAKPENNPDMDPELALALRRSMEEQQVRQQRVAVPLSSFVGEGPSQEKEKSSRSLVRVGGRPDNTGIDKPPTTTREISILGGYLEDTSSSTFTDSGNYGDSYTASSSTFGGSFAESSGHLLGALDGTEGERKAPKKRKSKKKKKKKHKHRSSEHRDSSKHQKERRVRSEAAESGNDIAARGE